ncbi:23S rRNA (pseudouridine(1915)-N(3))-methyltransferase RlmH [Pseudomonadota bacterium]
MTINIILVGKTKEKAISSLESSYSERLKPYIKINTICIKEETIQKGDFNAQKEIVIKKEGDKIIEKIPKNSFTVALDQRGKQYTSEDFSYLLADLEQKTGDITFIIGGCYGLSEKVRKRAKFLLSFSKMTLTHELIRPLLLEQIYRGYSLIKGKKYHY